MRVLVIDDNPLDIELVTRMLQKHLGARVESVHTAEEGQRRLKVEEFDVVLVDFCLPGQNGLDFVKSLRSQGLLTPVLLLTARSDPEMKKEAQSAGAADFISKDECMTAGLYRAVQAAAERGRAEKAIRAHARAEELRYDNEVTISSLERRIEILEASLASLNGVSEPPQIEQLHQADRHQVIKHLVRRYSALMKTWCAGEGETGQGADSLGGLAAELFRLGIGSEHLIHIHTRALQALRDENWRGTKRGTSCSPRIFLLELSLALLDDYRRAAFAHTPPQTQWAVQQGRDEDPPPKAAPSPEREGEGG